MRGATLPAVEVPARMHRRQSMKQNMSIPVNAIVKALEMTDLAATNSVTLSEQQR